MTTIEELKVGNRVSINENYDNGDQTGAKGTIVSIDALSWPVHILLDVPIGGLRNAQFDPFELDLLDENYPIEATC